MLFIRLILVSFFGISLINCAPNEEQKPIGELNTEKYSQEELLEVAPTPLHQSIINKKLPEDLAYEELYLHINTPNEKDGNTPLGLALATKQTQLAIELARVPNLDIYHSNKAGQGYVYLASLAGNFRVIQILAERHEYFDNLISDYEFSDLDFPASDGSRAIHVALTPEVAESLRILWGPNDFSIADHDLEGKNPIHRAIIDGRTSFLTWASSKYCSDYNEYFRDSVLPDWANDFLSSAAKETVEFIRWISPESDFEFYKALSANPFNGKDLHGQTPAHLAAKIANDAVIKSYLTCKYVDLTIKDENGQTPLHIAANNPSANALKWIINTPLNYKWWLNQQEWIAIKDLNGNQALHIAAINPFQTDSYNELLKVGVNEEALNNDGQSAKSLFQIRISTTPQFEKEKFRHE